MLPLSVHSLLRELRVRDRRPLSQFFESLEQDPNQLGDYQERDDTLRDIEVKVVGRWSVAYWVDHPVLEVKVVDVRPADRV